MDELFGDIPVGAALTVIGGLAGWASAAVLLARTLIERNTRHEQIAVDRQRIETRLAETIWKEQREEINYLRAKTDRQDTQIDELREELGLCVTQHQSARSSISDLQMTVNELLAKLSEAGRAGGG